MLYHGYHEGTTKGRKGRRLYNFLKTFSGEPSASLRVDDPVQRHDVDVCVSFLPNTASWSTDDVEVIGWIDDEDEDVVMVVAPRPLLDNTTTTRMWSCCLFHYDFFLVVNTTTTKREYYDKNRGYYYTDVVVLMCPRSRLAMLLEVPGSSTIDEEVENTT